MDNNENEVKAGEQRDPAKEIILETIKITGSHFLNLLQTSLRNNIDRGITREMATGIYTVVEISINEFLASKLNEPVRK